MFQFNFKVDSATNDSGDESAAAAESTRHWLPGEKHKSNMTRLQATLQNSQVEETTIGNTKIRYLNMESAAERVYKEGTSQYISQIFNQHTDLVPAVYEGGLKIWECTWDLLQCLAASDLRLKNKRVLEVGCGAGLPALYCALQGAHVTLQDYNKEVIEYVTIPNIALNLCEDANDSDKLNGLYSRADFFSGDWGNLASLLSSQAHNNTSNDQKWKFDLILTSETIYNIECHQKLLDLLTGCLQTDGLILLAAKTHYFGVGGGTQQFSNLVRQQGCLDVHTTTTNTDGVKREILKMKLKGNNK